MGSQLGRWKNNCVEYPQQLAILNIICVFPTTVLGYTRSKRWLRIYSSYKFICSELHPQCTAHFSSSSPEFSTFLGYHRGFKKCRLLGELQHFPQSRMAAASRVLHLWAVSNFLALKIPYQILGVFLPYQSWYFVDRSNSTYLHHSIHISTAVQCLL